MSFIDLRFYPAAIGLLAVVVLVQFIFRKNGRVSNILSKAILLAFSYIVMAMYDVRFCLCMTGVILFTWLMGMYIGRLSGRARRLAVVSSVVVLAAVLGVFKYLNFFMTVAMSAVGRQWNELNIILPLGISFYIFSAIGYILDVSWGKTQPERSVIDMALFLAFFPKQICGPIVNGRDFLPQLKENRGIRLKGLEAGIQIFMFGLFKKIVLADHMAVFVNDVFASPTAYGTPTIWLAVFGYFIQLYFDFSGYSDMAIGASKMFGYDISQNFNLPFIARNISDFWDRWHISLSSWLNEYIFNPVAIKLKRRIAQLPKDKRARCKMLPTYAALLITFLISGLWHGAGFTYILWGLCHGVYSIIHSMYANWMKKHHREFAKNKPKPVILLDILANYFVVNIIQVLFRAGSMKQALLIYGRMFSVQVGIEQPSTWTFIAAAVLLAATLAAYLVSRKKGLSMTSGFYPAVDLSTIRGLTVFFIFCSLTVALAYFGEAYFLYGKF